MRRWCQIASFVNAYQQIPKEKKAYLSGTAPAQNKKREGGNNKQDKARENLDEM